MTAVKVLLGVLEIQRILEKCVSPVQIDLEKCKENRIFKNLNKGNRP